MPHYQQQILVAARRQQVATLYLQRKSQYEIADLLHVSQPIVSQDLKALQAKWLASALRDFDAAKAEELQRIDAAEREYWDGWSRSKQPREVSVTEATEGGDVAPKRTARMHKEDRVGDPRFLDGVMKCIERRCDILGLSTATQAAKELSEGLASLLVQAKQSRDIPGAQRPPPLAPGSSPGQALAEA